MRAIAMPEQPPSPANVSNVLLMFTANPLNHHAGRFNGLVVTRSSSTS